MSINFLVFSWHKKYIITLDVACAIDIDSGVSVDCVASVDGVRGGCFGVLITWKIIRLKKFLFEVFVVTLVYFNSKEKDNC